MMPKTHYKLDRGAIRKGEERDRDAERETAERHGFYQYKRFVLVPIGRIEHQPVWNPGRIEGILDAIDRGKPLPPIRADKDGGKYAITDGIHRYNASLQRGFTHVPVLETVTVDAPEMYVPPMPEKPVLRPGTYVKLTEKPYRATSLWARVEEYLGPYRGHGDVTRHVYALDGIVRGRVDFVGDWHDDKFEVGRPPRDVLQAFEAEDATMRASAPRVALRFATVRKTAALFVDEGMVGEDWGSSASGLLVTDGDRVLLLKRSPHVQDPGLWGVPGGAVPVDYDTGKRKDPKRSALDEAGEEMGGIPSGSMVGKHVFSKPSGFTFTTFVWETDPESLDQFAPRLNWEHTDWGLFDLHGITPSGIHPGVLWVLKRMGR